MFKADPWGLKTLPEPREKVLRVEHISPVFAHRPDIPTTANTQWRVVVITEVKLLSRPGETRERKRTVTVRGADELAVYRKLIGGNVGTYGDVK